MADGLADPPPVLVLGLGNLLLGDDGVGLRLLDELCAAAHWPPEVEFVDGGTQGVALLGWLAGRRALLLLDAVGLGAPAGTVHCLSAAEVEGISARRAGSAHEGNAMGLLAAARLTGCCPASLAVLGIEPAELRTQVGLSAAVEAAIPQAVECARNLLAALSGGLCAAGAAWSRIGPCVDNSSSRP
jgi:hydrogenase maturation protease